MDSLLQGEGYGSGEPEQSPLTVQDLLVVQGQGQLVGGVETMGVAGEAIVRGQRKGGSS